MKRMAAILALVCVLGIALLAVAAETPYLTVENAAQTGDRLCAVLHSNLLENAAVSDMTIACDGEQLSDLKLMKLNESATGSSLLFLVDNSASVREKTLTQMKTIVKQLCNHLRSCDNAALLTLSESSEAAWAATAPEMETALEGVTRLKNNPSLYETIQSAIVTLQTANQAMESRCLVILSDGQDAKSTGITIDELYTLAAQVTYPIYVVSFVQDSDDVAQTRAARSLGGIARASASGMEITLGLDKQTPESVTLSLLTKLTDAYTLSAALPDGALLATGNHSCNVTYNDGQSAYQASGQFAVLAGGAAAGEPLPSPTSSDDAAPTPDITQTITTNPDGKVPVWLIIVLCAVVLTAATVALLALRAKKTSKAVNDPIPTTDMNNHLPEEEPQEQPAEAPAECDEPSADSPVIDIYASPAAYHLIFAEVGGADKNEYSADLAQRVYLGRDAEQCDVVLLDDKMISSKHCCIEAQNGELFVFDLHSTNGTQLNGVPVTSATLLHQDDVIRLGRTTLRIRWQENGKG